MRMKSRRTLAVLLSMILLLALAPSGFAVDLEAPNTLTVNLAPADSGFAEDLATASIQADLYLLAPATAAGTDDSYTYAVPKAGEKGYPSPFQAPLEELMTKLADDPDLEKQNSKDKVYSTFEPLAQAFAGIVLGNTYTSGPIKSEANVSDHTTITVPGLEAGLYLLIIRGAGLTTKDDDPETGYVVKTEQAAGAGSTETPPQTVYATRVATDDYEYLYHPQLLTVPTKVSEENVQQYNTAYGNWVNTLTIYAKPTRESRLGDLKIIKNLNNAGPDRVDFVFEVSWEKRDGTTFKKYVSISFEGESRKEYVLEKAIPIGTSVTVNEVYTGLGYTMTSKSPSEPVEIVVPSADGSAQIATVEFTNDHGGPGGGHGVVNRFTAIGNNAFAWSHGSDSAAVDQETAGSNS